MDAKEVQLEQALELLNKCEQELNTVLTLGQRRDLLMDNFNWSQARCAEIVLKLSERGAL